MSLTANIAARDRHTARLAGDQPAAATRVALNASEAVEALFGWVYKQPGMATYDDCRSMLSRISAERGSVETKALMERFGCKRLIDLFPGLYVEFFEYAKNMLFYGMSPQDAWREDGKIAPNDLRDRWLLYHEGSDYLWEVRGRLGTELADGTVDDVSGSEAFEKRYAEQTVAPRDSL